jgi:hypothetical protein
MPKCDARFNTQVRIKEKFDALTLLNTPPRVLKAGAFLLGSHENHLHCAEKSARNDNSWNRQAGFSFFYDFLHQYE